MRDYNDNDSHLCVPTLGGNVHVIPTAVFTKIISGEMKIQDMDDWEVIVRTVFSEWLRSLANKEEDIKWHKKEAELHELDMQQNKDRMQALEEDLHKSIADLEIAKGEAQRQFKLNLRLREALNRNAAKEEES